MTKPNFFRKYFVLATLSLGAGLIVGCGAAQTDAQKAACTGFSVNPANRALVSLGATAMGGMNGAELAQSFRPGAEITVRFIDLPLIAVGNPSPAAMITLQIQGDSGGVPDGSTLATAFTQVSLVNSTQVTAVRFGLGSFKLQPNRTYWLRLSSNLPVSSTAYVAWAGAGGNPAPFGQAAFTVAPNNWSQAAAGITGFSGSDFDFGYSLSCL